VSQLRQISPLPFRDGTFGISLLHAVSTQLTWPRHSRTYSPLAVADAVLVSEGWPDRDEDMLSDVFAGCRSQLDTHLTCSRTTQPMHQPFSAAVSAPFLSTWAAFSNQRSASIWVLKEPLAWISLHYPGVSSFCGSTRRYLGSHKLQQLENCQHRVHCSAHTGPEPKSLQHLFHISSPYLGSKGRTGSVFLGSRLPYAIRVLREAVLRPLPICKAGCTHSHLMYGSSVSSARPASPLARTFPFSACRIWQVLSCSHFQSIALSSDDAWIFSPRANRQCSTWRCCSRPAWAEG